MPLWGTSADATTNKPKFCPADANSPYDKTKVFASQAGWVVRGPATGNGNTGADPEILIAIGGLAGASASTGLEHPTMTKYTIVTNDDHGTSDNIVFEIAYDEALRYDAGSAATLLLTADAGSNVTATLTHMNGVVLANDLEGNVLRFTATSAQADTYSLSNNRTMGDPDLKDAITGTAIETDSKKFTSARKTAIGYEDIVIA
tara:strand:- start:192 stop:800 length:609 start_codon:yes stop_codon:yes gene_type:complete